MIMDRISFNHFFIETKNRMPEGWFACINPETMTFWKVGDAYFAITLLGDIANIDMVIETGKNNLDSFRCLYKSLKSGGFKKLIFGTASDNKRMQTLYKYAKAKHLGTNKDVFKSGDSWEKYELDLTIKKMR